MIIEIVLSAVLLLAIVIPLVAAPNRPLRSGAAINDIDTLKAMKRAILKTYLKEEADHENQTLTNRQWQKRQTFLLGKYIDVAKRLNFLQARSGGQKRSEANHNVQEDKGGKR